MGASWVSRDYRSDWIEGLLLGLVCSISSTTSAASLLTVGGTSSPLKMIFE